ncbi:hypothetical protein, partial [Amycolatopsis sp. NPDC000740]|uniref:hypothetical protein n=1 Tax=Amycolatopsis sp. NPDC000740 TaxID=3154269 RepID=UPI003330AB44
EDKEGRLILSKKRAQYERAWGTIEELKEKDEPAMGGGKGGKGPEDKEHKVASFVESDDPSFFAPDEVVAPPVIGDWKNKDWK